MNPKEALYAHLKTHYYDVRDSLLEQAVYKGSELGWTQEAGWSEDEENIKLIPLETSVDLLVKTLESHGFDVMKPGTFRIYGPGGEPEQPKLRNTHYVNAARVLVNGKERSSHCILIGEDPLSENPTALIAHFDYRLLNKLIETGEIEELIIEGSVG